MPENAKGDGKIAPVSLSLLEKRKNHNCDHAARKAKDFARADAIRAELAAKGITIEDTAQGTRWHRNV